MRTAFRPRRYRMCAALAVLALAGPWAADARAAQDLPTVEELAQWAGSEDEAPALREGIGQRVAAASPGEATLWIQLLAVAERVGPDLGPVAVRAVGLATDARGRDGSVLILDALDEAGTEPAAGDAPVPSDSGSGAPVTGEASLLALAAHLSDPEDPAHAAEIRERLLAAHPEAAETPEARLLLARFYLETDDRREEAVRMLEEIIVQSPAHPVTPQARRLYEAHRDGGGSGPGGGTQ